MIKLDKEKNNNEIGEFLRNYRKENDDISLRVLSEKTGISYSHLSKIERGAHIPTKPTLKILSETLNLDLDTLYVMSGYAPENKDFIRESIPQYQTSEEKKKIEIVDKIAYEFPDADLMFNDLANMTAEQLEEVYEFIKFKRSQKK